MAITVVAAIPSRANPNTGHIETFYNNKRGAKARYNEFVKSGKFTFVYIADAIDAYPSGTR